MQGRGSPYKPPLKWQTLPTCHCEEQSDVAISPARSGQCRGADSRARRRTCNLYKPPSKWQTPPTCHCEERSDVAISQYYVGYHESSGENVTAFPRLHPKGTSSRFALRAPRPLRGLAMTSWGRLPFYRQPVLAVSAPPGPAARSPTMAGAINVTAFPRLPRPLRGLAMTSRGLSPDSEFLIPR